MVKRKIVAISTLEAREAEKQGFQTDYFSNLRSKSGYIKVGMTAKGASDIRQFKENEITRKTKELRELQSQASRLEDIEEKEKRSETKLSKKDKKRLKKQKKEEKKEKKKMDEMPESSRILFGEIKNYRKRFSDSKDGEAKFDGVTSKSKISPKTELTDEEKEARKEAREKQEFDKKFEEPLALIRLNMKDMDGAMDEINKLLEETRESRSRSKAVMMKDLISSKINLFNAKNSSAMNIMNIQKSRFDIEIKKTKESGGSGGDDRTKTIAIANKLFPQMIASGRVGSTKDDDKPDKKKGRKHVDTNEMTEKERERYNKEMFKESKKKNKGKADNSSRDTFNERITGLLRGNQLDFSPHEAAISMEGKYKVAIRRSYKDPDEYEIVAVDNNNQIIKGFKDDYPGVLPKKKSLNLRFDDEKDLARCRNTDQLFQVIPVPYL